jgi:hypothetical protein
MMVELIIFTYDSNKAMPPITSNNPTGNAIAAGKLNTCENKCWVAAISDSLEIHES